MNGGISRLATEIHGVSLSEIMIFSVKLIRASCCFCFVNLSTLNAFLILNVTKELNDFFKKVLSDLPTYPDVLLAEVKRLFIKSNSFKLGQESF